MTTISPEQYAAHKLWRDTNGAEGTRLNLSGAYLSRANLSRADLSGAYLSRANLCGADLSGAYLSGANLSGAYLSGAYLSGANLSGADLSGANLSGADLSGADLSGAKLPTGETLEEFTATLPALLCAGGRDLGEVAAAWDCHAWHNCPMHVAFGAGSINDVPEEHRPRAALFVALFDGQHLPRPA